MDILQIVIIAIVATLLIAVLKTQRPEIALVISICTGVIIFSFSTLYLDSIIKTITEIADRINLDTTFIGIILKIIAVSYICEFGSQLCKDAGEGSIASKVELAGKVFIVYLSSPIIFSLLNLLTSLF